MIISKINLHEFGAVTFENIDELSIITKTYSAEVIFSYSSQLTYFCLNLKNALMWIILHFFFCLTYLVYWTDLAMFIEQPFSNIEVSYENLRLFVTDTKLHRISNEVVSLLRLAIKVYMPIKGRYILVLSIFIHS